MVVKIMGWRPWPPLISKKFRVNLTVHRLEGRDWVLEKTNGGVVVEIKWKGPKISLGSFRRTVRRNYTKDGVLKRVDDDDDDDESNGAVLVDWDEQFHSICSLSEYKDNLFHPWEIQFSALHMSNQGSKNKIPVIGVAKLNLAEYAAKSDVEVTKIKIPLMVPTMAVENSPVLNISLSLVELIDAAQEANEVMQSPITPLPSPSPSRETEKDEVSALKARLKKVKIFTEYVSIRKAKKACREEGSGDGRSPAKSSEEAEYSYTFDSDSVEEFEEGESDEVKGVSEVRTSFSYGTLASANYAGVSSYSNAINNDGEGWIYYSNRRRSDVGQSHVEDTVAAVPEEPLVVTSKRSILPWRKRKLSFRSPKAKGEPLLKKEAYGEEGGDDIDFDRRQLSPDSSVLSVWLKTDEDSNANSSSVSEFGDDSFAVGAWEQKEITSRDGLMKIETKVFFASIDQRNEKAAGEGACTALVAVIADWLQNNLNLMPIKSQFDSLIRDGSLEWRNLCENDIYKERFPDKHFDLETVLEAQIRDLHVIPNKSFIGFFHPEEIKEGNFEFLNSAMSFDDIWDEIAILESSGNPKASVFIISWNDHFFVLKVEPDAYYIIDTLGERLHEGCNQAYILKFDKDTAIYKLPTTTEQAEEKPAKDCPDLKDELICQGKETCKEYMKSFLAAIPIRELQADIKKGLSMSAPLHHRLQIEFHLTEAHLPKPVESPTEERVEGSSEVVNDEGEE